MDRCHLCDKEMPLVLSHIIPSFIYKWLKDSSGTGHIRFGEHPNQRVQDGYKCYLLCNDCESLFSSWEKKFAEQIFVPLHEKNGYFLPYGDWLAKFAVSVSWRVLLYFKLINVLTNYPAHHIVSIEKALKVWKDFLLGNSPHPSNFEQHLLPFNTISGFKGFKEVPSNINRYILRSIDLDVAYTSTEIFVYSKMCKAMLIGFVEIPDPKHWKGTKIHIKHGMLGSKHYYLPSNFGEYILDRTRRVRSIQETMSSRQKEKIDKAYRADPDHAVRSESFEALEQDVFLFGKAAFITKDE